MGSKKAPDGCGELRQNRIFMRASKQFQRPGGVVKRGDHRSLLKDVPDWCLYKGLDRFHSVNGEAVAISVSGIQKPLLEAVRRL